MAFKITRIQRLSAVILISMSFFIAEIAVGFYTGSLALMADAFHYLSDIFGFVIALIAAIVSEKATAPPSLTFGWQRAQLLGAFFNGVLLLGLGISIFLQSIERFISLERVDDPKLVVIIGCVGFGLNLISLTFLHGHEFDEGFTEHDHDRDHGGDEHDHGHTHGQDHGHDHHEHEHERGDHDSDGHNDHNDSQVAREHAALINEKHITHKHHMNAASWKPRKNFDLALMGVFIHIMGDCANNVGVIISGLVIWLANYSGRYYADPAVGMAIAIMIFASSLPLVKRSGLILLQSAPQGVEHDDVKHDLEQIPGIAAVHELHIWRLNQKKSLASTHLVLDETSDETDFNKLAKTVNECFHAYGIHSVTLQPETIPGRKGNEVVGVANHRDGRVSLATNCQLICGKLCEDLSCCQ
ncbi:metal ion resistance protein/transporter (Zrc1) [Penicillium samsonianum]|uniref:metal ion resistance protein/transporter (Zrc1) n=1 Tax=Penicillium samsonianum TaxID=1882272 RepID=UPI00254903C8|nr:metal ion resistance protein/transporter (Zrc1) [Penicillium samsonianum]KAJ6119010.1 metal ion resistance protein/transporter (Zrc1) [Penicillium samsonianum]